MTYTPTHAELRLMHQLQDAGGSLDFTSPACLSAAKRITHNRRQAMVDAHLFIVDEPNQCLVLTPAGLDFLLTCQARPWCPSMEPPKVTWRWAAGMSPWPCHKAARLPELDMEMQPKPAPTYRVYHDGPSQRSGFQCYSGFLDGAQICTLEWDMFSLRTWDAYGEPVSMEHQVGLAELLPRAPAPTYRVERLGPAQPSGTTYYVYRDDVWFCSAVWDGTRIIRTINALGLPVCEEVEYELAKLIPPAPAPTPTLTRQELVSCLARIHPDELRMLVDLDDTIGDTQWGVRWDPPALSALSDPRRYRAWQLLRQVEQAHGAEGVQRLVAMC